MRGVTIQRDDCRLLACSWKVARRSRWAKTRTEAWPILNPLTQPLPESGRFVLTTHLPDSALGSQSRRKFILERDEWSDVR